MRIWLYCICRDEIKILPYFLRHYSLWVDRMIFYDGGSTDGTREIIQACPQAELRVWPGSEGIVDDEFMDFANEQWKEARGQADWIVWCDADEFLFHPNMLPLLQEYLNAGVTGPRIAGYTMVSDHFPTTEGQIYDEVKTGFPDDIWDKQAIFREGIHFNVGRHSLYLEKYRPVPSPTAEIKLLHYRALGLDYVRERHRRNWERVPERCRNRNFGNNTSPEYVGHHSLDWFAERISKQWPEVIP